MRTIPSFLICGSLNDPLFLLDFTSAFLSYSGSVQFSIFAYLALVRHLLSLIRIIIFPNSP